MLPQFATRFSRHATWLRHAAILLLVGGFVSLGSWPASAGVNNGANAENVLGQFASYPADTSVSYTDSQTPAQDPQQASSRPSRVLVCRLPSPKHHTQMRH